MAQAIDALGRGRSAVIVGDSQQMPPTSFGQVTASDDETDEDGELAPEDLDSILTECVESGVPRLWLSWHYRSQDERLIDFSNQKYYEGRLASLPSPGGDLTAGVEWRRVTGHFNRESRTERRTNRVEAEAVVEEIRTRLTTPHLAAQSIGVVTFNAQQRSLAFCCWPAARGRSLISTGNAGRSMSKPPISPAARNGARCPTVPPSPSPVASGTSCWALFPPG